MSSPFSSNDSSKDDAVCHTLPCSIDYTGTVDGSQFQPTKLVEDEEIEAVCLRGRGLLARAPSTSIPSNNASGRVFQVQEQQQEPQDHQEGSTVLKEIPSLRFSSVQEWHHEHNPTAVSLKSSRMNDALEWCAVAQALHAPLPVSEEG